MVITEIKTTIDAIVKKDFLYKKQRILQKYYDSISKKLNNNIKAKIYCFCLFFVVK